MSPNRRRLLHNIFGFSAGLSSLRHTASAMAAEGPTLAPLRALGLDPFEVYVKMFASMGQGAECCWWFMGALPRDVEDVGPVDTIQEETVRIHRTEVIGPGQIDVRWREVGVFRDIITGEVPDQRFDPVTGISKPGNSLLGGGPGVRVSIRTAGDELSVSLDQPGSTTGAITLSASIDGNRVCLTHIEDKTRIQSSGPPAPTNRTAYKIYANLNDLKGAEPSVQADGFYGVKNRDTGKVFVNGLMRKAALDEKVNPIAWNRLKMAHPTFFKGDRLGPTWAP
jgi:hypothetical protein